MVLIFIPRSSTHVCPHACTHAHRYIQVQFLDFKEQQQGGWACCPCRIAYKSSFPWLLLYPPSQEWTMVVKQTLHSKTVQILVLTLILPSCVSFYLSQHLANLLSCISSPCYFLSIFVTPLKHCSSSFPKPLSQVVLSLLSISFPPDRSPCLYSLPRQHSNFNAKPYPHHCRIFFLNHTSNQFILLFKNTQQSPNTLP